MSASNYTGEGAKTYDVLAYIHVEADSEAEAQVRVRDWAKGGPVRVRATTARDCIGDKHHAPLCEECHGRGSNFLGRPCWRCKGQGFLPV